MKLKNRIIRCLVWETILLCIFTTAVSANLSSDVLNKLKKATVYIVLESGNESKSGSGFIVHKKNNTGLIITNAHVIDSKQKGRNISVVFNSGTESASIVSAHVAGVNIDADLALLEIVSEDIPDPIRISEISEVSETQEVFILGFPFGGMLATNRDTPNITISKGIVSSKRRDDNDQLFLIQIDGDINMGNSGGPIVTQDGELTGVSVATITATNIGFAIPAYKVRTMINGCLANITLSPDKDNSRVRIQTDVIDPLKHIASASLITVPKKDVILPEKIDSDGIWKSISDDNRFLQFKPSETHQMIAEFDPRKEEGDEFYAQICVKTKGEKIIYQSPFTISVNRTYRITLSGPDVIQNKSRPNKSDTPESETTKSPSAPFSENMTETPDDKTVVKMPSPVKDIIVAGGGKYLLFKYEHQIGIWDVASDQWRDPLTVSAPDFFMAANREKIFIVKTNNNHLISVNINTLQKEKETEIPDISQIRAISIGWNSLHMPLILFTSDNIYFVNTDSLLPIEFEWSDKSPRISERDIFQLRASANGKLFTFWQTDISPSGVNIIQYSDRNALYLYEHDTAGYLAPDSAGKFVYTNLKGIYNSSLKSAGSLNLKKNHLFPDMDGKYFLKINYKDKKPSLSIHDVDSHLTAATLVLPEMKNDFHPMSFHKQIVSEEKRFYLFSDHKKLVTIPFSDDKMIIRKIVFEDSEVSDGI